jgi:lantibiotic modifying enzyme
LQLTEYAAEEAMRWRPLLDGERRARALSRVHAIADALRGRALDDPTLANGHAGLALLFAELASAGGDAHFADAAQRSLERAIDALAARPLPPGLFHGFAGVAWVARRLGADSAATAEIDELLLRALEPGAASVEFDLLGGTVGLGVYALEYWRQDGRRALVDACVAHLARHGERVDDTITWRTDAAYLPPEMAREFPDGRYGLGMAHGVTAALPFLAAAARIGNPDAAALASGVAAWLQRHERTNGGFSNFTDDDKPARLAWCYGDCGAAIAWWRAGEAMHQPAWRAMGQRLAAMAAARDCSDDATRITEGGLCHGAGGVALLLHAMYLSTGDGALGAAATRWADWLLTPERCARTFGADPAFLTGDAGEAMALLALVSTVAPTWPRALLIR